MIALFNNIKIHLKVHAERYVCLFLLVISILSAFYFYQGDKQLLYGDALSRMNISRKIVDNLTPGLAQLGNVWLPLPQLLMLPFVLNNFLWHSGLAGTVVSAFFFVLGGVYIFKTSKLLTNSYIASFLGLLVFALNINLLYLQTTAMSEAIFLGILAVFAYYFLLWAKTSNNYYLVPAAISVSALTLVRYEALAILFSSIPFVAIYTYLKTKSYKRAEGATVLYGTLAILGFFIWSLYLKAIFGDALYWAHYYVVSQTPSQPQLSEATTAVAPHNANFLYSLWWYLTAVVWMNGVFPVLLAVLGSFSMLYETIKKRQWFAVAIFVQLSLFLFMILTLMRNTPINQPLLSIANLLSPKTSYFPEFNIRYGILMLPFISLSVAYLLKSKHLILKFVFILIFSTQILNYFYYKYSFIFQFNQSIAGNTTQGELRDKDMETWLQQNYDNGLILISAEKHDPQMFQLGLNYKTYIHEGTAYYWKESMVNPAKYAKWVVMDYQNPQDGVTKKLKDSPILEQKFDLVHNFQNMRVYKLKDS